MEETTYKSLRNDAMEAFMKTYTRNAGAFMTALNTLDDKEVDLSPYNNPTFGEALMLGNIAAFYVFKSAYGRDKALDIMCGDNPRYRKVYLAVDANLTPILASFANDQE